MKADNMSIKNTVNDKSGKSNISIACKSFSPSRRVNYSETYSFIKGHPLNGIEFTVGDFEALDTFAQELSGYVERIKKMRKGGAL